MNGKHYIGKRVSSLDLYDELGPITGVALLVDDENEIFSGDETGYVLEMECPYATQEMADNILASVSGQTYKGFRAQDAKLPVDSELGDGVTVNGTYSLLAYQMVSFGVGHVSEIAAPGENTVDHEYPYLSPIKKEITRKIAGVRSSIEKTSEAIKMIVEELGGSYENYTELELNLDGVFVKDETGATKITGSSIETGSLNLSGCISFSDLSDYSTVNSRITSASSTASSAYSRVNSWTYTGSTYIDGEMIMAGTVYASYLKGGSIGILNEDGTETATMTPGLTTGEGLSIESQGNLYLKGAYGHFLVNDEAAWVSAGATDASAFCPAGTSLSLGATDYGVWSALYASSSEIVTSDRNRKNSIEELPEKYLTMLDAVLPCRFKLNDGSSDRYHVGFIAQEVEDAMTAAGVDSQEFAGFVRDADADGNEILMLRYEEFIGILLAKIKQLESRLTALEG